MDLEEALAAVPVVAILRAPSADRFPDVVAVLLEHGVLAVELALTTPGAMQALAVCRDTFGPQLALGAGTVLDGAQARRAAQAGAQYLISPAVCLEVVEEARRLGIPAVPGAFTVTEIVTAREAGATAVKVFPASVGGPAFIAAVRGPLPDVPLVPTGGVGIEDAAAYLDAGALAVGMGSPLVGDACTGGDLDALAERADRLVKALDRRRTRRG